MKKVLVFLCAIALVFSVVGTAGAYTFYTDRSLWEADAVDFINTTELGPAYSSIAAGSPIDIGYGESLVLDTTMSVRTIGSGWATWSGGYTGDVLFGGDQINTIRAGITPGLLSGFGFEAEPNDFATWNVSLTMYDGSVVDQDVTGRAGAAFFGFTVDAGDPAIIAMTISADPEARGFAIGNFVAAAPVPEPATMLLFGVGLVALGGVARRRFKK